MEPHKASTTYQFKYWRLSEPGNKISVPSSPGSAGSGSGWVKVSQAIGGLPSGTQYGYELVSSNSGGSSGAVGQSKEGEGTLKEEPGFTTVPELAYQGMAAPLGEASNTIDTVSCVSVSWCMAVGETQSIDGALAPLTEVWNGSQFEWRLKSAAIPSGVTNPLLGAVSCVSSSFCLASGADSNSEGTGSFLDRWNGSQWSLVYSVTHGGPSGGVSCLSTTFCMDTEDSWNGTEVQTHALPVPYGWESAKIYGVSCTSTSYCVGAGAATKICKRGEHECIETQPVIQAMTASWNGNEWSTSMVSVPPINGRTAENSILSGVSCYSATVCWAVGHEAEKQLLNRPRPLAVSIGSGAEGGGEVQTAWTHTTGAYLTGVSCAGKLSCLAVGTVEQRGALIERLTATNWQIIAPSHTEATPESALSSMSCVAEMTCTAVGGYKLVLYGSNFAPWAAAVTNPTVETTAATGVGSTEATLNGTVNPEGEETTYHFEYGSTTKYGTSVPVPNANAGSGTANKEVSIILSGLQSSTTYHYRLVAKNPDGKVQGHEMMFTTSP